MDGDLIWERFMIEGEEGGGVEAIGESHLKISSHYKELFALAIAFKKSFRITTHIDHDSYMEFEWDPALGYGCITLWNDGLKSGVQDGIEVIADIEFTN